MLNILDLKDKLGVLKYYSKQNLGLILNKEGESLNYWIKRLIGKRILIPLKKGIYVSSFYLDKVKDKQVMENYYEYLANVLCFPSYISLEYALSKYEIIPESAFRITSVTTKTTREYKSEMATFTYKTIKKTLFKGFCEQIYDRQKIKIAQPAKALFDFLYFRSFPDVFDMQKYLLDVSRINWSVFDKNDKKNFRQYLRESESVKMEKIEKILVENKIL